MKSLAVVGIALILAGCTGETTVIREVQVTPPPVETTISEPDNSDEIVRYSRAEVIADAQEFAPSLRIYDDATMESLMLTACDSIESWAPDYESFLASARSSMSDSTELERDEIVAIITAAIYSVCTEHQIGINRVLDEESNGY